MDAAETLGAALALFARRNDDRAAVAETWDRLSGLGIERDQATVGRVHIDAPRPVRNAAADIVVGITDFDVEPGIEATHLFAGAGIECADLIERRAHIELSLGEDRRVLEAR